MDALTSLSSASSVQATVAARLDGAAMRTPRNAQNIDKISKDFEAMFMAQMLQPMFETVSVDGDFGGGHGEEMMRGFMVQEFGRSMAENGNIGLAASIKSRMLQTLSSAEETKIGSKIEVKA